MSCEDLPMESELHHADRSSVDHAPRMDQKT
jgi:hypothetical protein